MSEKSSLLKQLRIDRDAPENGGETRNLLPWAAGGVGALVVILGILIFTSGSDGVPVRAATARGAVGTGPSSAGASLLDASGYVVARRIATVSSKVTGKVVGVFIEEGQVVEEGEVLAQLDDSNARATFAQAKAQLAQAEANAEAATAAYENASPLFERNKELVAEGVISANTFEASKTNYDAARTGLAVAKSAVDVASAALTVAQRNLDDMTVRAPFSGVVTVKAAQPGEMVSPISAGGGFTRTGICTVVDMESLEVQVDVSENFISRVYAGQSAVITLNAYPDWRIPGEIIAVIPTADRAKATVLVRVAFKEKDERVIPDMGARVSFLDDRSASASDGEENATPQGVIVPADAVQASGGSGTVFVVDGDRVERRTVRLGARNASGQTVLSGLAPGDRVAIGDFSQLSDGAKINIE